MLWILLGGSQMECTLSIGPFKEIQKWMYNHHEITFELCDLSAQIDKNKNHSFPFIIYLNHMIYLSDHVPLILISLLNYLGSLLTYSYICRIYVTKSAHPQR